MFGFLPREILKPEVGGGFRRSDHVCRRRVAILLGGRKKKERKRRKGKREKRAVSLSVELVFLVGKRRKEEKSRDERDAVHRRACY